jgi:hypothetical protein
MTDCVIETETKEIASGHLDACGRSLVKRTYAFEESVVHNIHRQAMVPGTIARNLANALLKQGLARIVSGDLETSIVILPEHHVRGPHAVGRYIAHIRHHTDGASSSEVHYLHISEGAG